MYFLCAFELDLLVLSVFEFSLHADESSVLGKDLVFGGKRNYFFLYVYCLHIVKEVLNLVVAYFCLLQGPYPSKTAHLVHKLLTSALRRDLNG